MFESTEAFREVRAILQGLELRQQQAEAAKLDAAIEVNLKSLGLIANQEGSR